MRVADVLRQVFANAAMRRVQAGWLLAITAEWVYLINLLVLGYLLGGVLGVGLVGMLRSLPAAVLAPFLATLSDRLPRHRVLLGVHVVRAMVILLMALAAFGEIQAVIVFGGALVEGIVATLHRPTTMSLMPGLARSPQELVASNVSISLSEGLGVLIGPALGGLLVATAGAPFGLVAGSVGLGLAAILVLGVRPVHAPAERFVAVTGVGRTRQLLAGFGVLRANPHVALLVAVVSSQTFVRGILTVLLVAFSLELLLLGEAGVGYLNSALGAGGLVGGVLALALITRRSLSVPLLIALALWGIPISAMGLFPSALLAFALMGVIGAANAVLDIAAFTLLQRTVPNEVRGRVFGALEGLIALTVGLGSLAAPVLVALVGLPGALVVTGLLLPAVAVTSARAVRRVEERAVVPERELALLRGVPIFAPLPLTIIEQLSSSLERQVFDAATDIVHQGDPGECYYVIAAGIADVLRDGRSVAALAPGEGFGEIALLRDVPRTATVRSRTQVEVLRLGRSEFLAAVTGSSHSMDAADALVGSRLQTLGRD